MIKWRRVAAAVALTLALLLAFGCGGGTAPGEEEGPPPPAALRACTVELSGIYLVSGAGVPLFGSGSADSLVKVVDFTISNPNDYMVSIDGFSYKLDPGEGLDVAEEAPFTYFIPAGEKITLEGVVSLLWTELYTGLGGGLPYGVPSESVDEWVAATLPLWKGLGGPRPDIMYYGYRMTVSTDAWEAVEPTEVTYKWEARLHTKGEGMDKYSTYNGSF